ncbi:MAG TPA: hypothetical protein VIV12_00330 [Streptosporangiaceae bacterium]
MRRHQPRKAKNLATGQYQGGDVANGEIGMAVGWPTRKGRALGLWVEFSTQSSLQFTFWEVKQVLGGLTHEYHIAACESSAAATREQVAATIVYSSPTRAIHPPASPVTGDTSGAVQVRPIFGLLPSPVRTGTVYARFTAGIWQAGQTSAEPLAPAPIRSVASLPTTVGRGHLGGCDLMPGAVSED